MLVTIDKSNMSNSKKVIELDPKLGEYLDAVAMLKPLCNFVATDNNVSSTWKNYVDEDGNKDRKLFEYLSSVAVYENGERLGDIGISETYRRTEGGSIYVYFVESFRISKERGHQNRTYTKHLKVALRAVTKSFIPRADVELINQISHHVSYQLGNIVSGNYNQARWSIDCDTEAMTYAFLAYKANLRGEATVTLPSILPTANKRSRDGDDFKKYMELYDEALRLAEHRKNDKGYAVQAKSDKSFVVCNFDKTEPNTLCKYKSIDDMPKHLGDKLSALKLLGKHEPVGHIGMKINTDDDPNVEYYYLVSGDIIFE